MNRLIRGLNTVVPKKASITTRSSSSNSLPRCDHLQRLLPNNISRFTGGVCYRFRSDSTTTAVVSDLDSTTTATTKVPYSSKYEYPLATEAPEITRSIAKDVVSLSSSISNNNPICTKLDTLIPDDSEKKDPFDDMGTLSVSEIEEILRKQQLELRNRSLQTTRITTTIPSYIPPNVSSTDLTTPSTRITTLENGVRIVSHNTYGQVSTVGVVTEMGSRMERYKNPTTKGVSNVLELLTFGTTQKYGSGQELNELLQDYGGNRFNNIGREQSVFCIDILRPRVVETMQMLNEIIMHPLFETHDVEDAKMTLRYSLQSMPPELLLSEAIQEAAYGLDQELGQPHFVKLNQLDDIQRGTCLTYWDQNLLQNPQGLVIGGANIEHDDLVNIVHEHTQFGHLQQKLDRTNMLKQCRYIGGEARCIIPDPTANSEEENDFNNSMPSLPSSQTMEEQQFVKVAIAFEVGGWRGNQLFHPDGTPLGSSSSSTDNNSNQHDSDRNEKDLVTACVLQTLLGGGSSFSAGGPGKGMYSRLYRQILNRYAWAESAEAFTSFYHETGLFGMMGTADSYHIRDMVCVLCDHFLQLSNVLVTDEELDRAKNMLKNNVLTQLESRLVLFEDISRQVLTYGFREDMNVTVQKIENVTANDIMNLMQRSIRIGYTHSLEQQQSTTTKSPRPLPTIASVGMDLTNVPYLDEVKQWFE